MPKNVAGTNYLSVTELADELDIHRNNIIYWIKQGRIHAVRLGMAEKSPFFIPREEANRVIAEFKEPTPVVS